MIDDVKSMHSKQIDEVSQIHHEQIVELRAACAALLVLLFYLLNVCLYLLLSAIWHLRLDAHMEADLHSISRRREEVHR